jgi:hypothetical protein
MAAHAVLLWIFVLKDECGEGQFAEAMDKTTQNLLVITGFENIPD